MTPSPNCKILLPLLALILASFGCLKQKQQIDSRNFSVEQCGCPEITLPLIEDGSHASNSTYQTTVSGYEGEIEIKGRLTCVWKEEYKSDQKVGLITANLEVIRIQEEAQAKAIYKQYKEQISDKPGYCEQDQHCYVTEYSTGPERIMYAEENTYSENQEQLLPSYHSAHLIRNIDGPNDHFVVNLTFNHPELDPGSNYVTDTVKSIEACLETLAGR